MLFHHAKRSTHGISFVNTMSLLAAGIFLFSQAVPVQASETLPYTPIDDVEIQDVAENPIWLLGTRNELECNVVTDKDWFQETPNDSWEIKDDEIRYIWTTSGSGGFEDNNSVSPEVTHLSPSATHVSPDEPCTVTIKVEATDNYWFNLLSNEPNKTDEIAGCPCDC